jgi:hypothetical protein
MDSNMIQIGTLKQHTYACLLAEQKGYDSLEQCLAVALDATVDEILMIPQIGIKQASFIIMQIKELN